MNAVFLMIKLHNTDIHDQYLIRLLLQSQSDLGLHCLSRPFCQATSVQNFRTFTVSGVLKKETLLMDLTVFAISFDKN